MPTLSVTEETANLVAYWTSEGCEPDVATKAQIVDAIFPAHVDPNDLFLTQTSPDVPEAKTWWNCLSQWIAPIRQHADESTLLTSTPPVKDGLWEASQLLFKTDPQLKSANSRITVVHDNNVILNLLDDCLQEAVVGHNVKVYRLTSVALDNWNKSIRLSQMNSKLIEFSGEGDLEALVRMGLDKAIDGFLRDRGNFVEGLGPQETTLWTNMEYSRTAGVCNRQLRTLGEAKAVHEIRRIDLLPENAMQAIEACSRPRGSSDSEGGDEPYTGFGIHFEQTLGTEMKLQTDLPSIEAEDVLLEVLFQVGFRQAHRHDR